MKLVKLTCNRSEGVANAENRNKGTAEEQSQTLKNLTWSLANVWASPGEIIYSFILSNLVPVLTYSHVGCLRTKAFITVNRRNFRKTFNTAEFDAFLGKKKTSWQY